MLGVCLTATEKARKAHGAVLQVLQNAGKQGAIAAAMGSSDSTVSRIKNEHLENAITVLYCAGFKVVESAMRCYPAQDVEAWYAAYRREMLRSETAAQLFQDME